MEMTCCTALLILIIALFMGALSLWLYLYLNHFRIKYFDLKMLLPGKRKPAEVGNYYDAWHERYKDVYGDTIQSYRSENIGLLHQYVMESAGLKDGMKVLDAGCGLCGPAVYFAGRLNISIEAVTVSQKQAEAAEENIVKSGLQDKISIKQGDFHQIDKLYPENHFDVVLFLESYGHAQSQARLLKAASKVLKKGGHIYIKDYFKKDLPDNLFQRNLIRMGTRNMNNIYRYNTPDLYHTIYLLRKLNFELKWLRIPDIPDWDGNKVIQEFHEKNNIAFYNHKDELFDQNNGRFIVDPYEMLFYKR